MINIAYLPNIFFDDWLLTIKVLLQPWLWEKGEAEIKLKKEIEKRLSGQIHLFASGRGALLVLLKAFGIKTEDEVIIQAFTCVAVIDPILAVDAVPVYVDINENYNIDINDLKRKITVKTKAIIVQHTFGIPAEIEVIIKMAHERNILVIEDLAHGFGNEVCGKKLGTFGDACFLSFGRTKVISSMFGGALGIKDMKIRRDEDTKNKMEILIKNQAFPSSWWIFKQFFHQTIFYLLKPFYDFLGVGKGILLILSKLKVSSYEVESKEKQGEMVGELTKKMPNGLCLLALHQLQKLDSFTDKRKKISIYYQENLDKNKFKFPLEKTAYLRFPVELNQYCHNSVNNNAGFELNNASCHCEEPLDCARDKLCDEAILAYQPRLPRPACGGARNDNNAKLVGKEELLQYSKKLGIYLGDWYSQPVAPKGVDFNKIGYLSGSCPKAEEKNKMIFNLPTCPTLNTNQVKKIVEVVNEFSY